MDMLDIGEEHEAEAPPPVRTRKPRLALMGEFSAGKSTLANLLMEQKVSPVQVTATQMPPIWYSHGEPAVIRIDRSGNKTRIRPADMARLTPENTRAVRIRIEAEVLEFCDLIDMPGTSDPNMAQSVWQNVLSKADGVLWCTAATQAWRQSEAALWETMPDELRRNSLLLITRMDKLLSDRDKARVVARVRREAGHDFLSVHPVSLTAALSAGADENALKASGATDLVDALIGLVEAIGPVPLASERGDLRRVRPQQHDQHEAETETDEAAAGL